MKLGDIVKEYRTAHKLSMEKFAVLAKVSKGYVSMLEKGENPKTKKPISPSFDTIKNIAVAMNRDFDDLVAELDDTQKISIENYKPNPAVVNLDKHLNTENKDSWINHGEQLLSSQQAQEQAQPVRLVDYTSHTENTLRGSAIAPENNIDEKVANFDDYRKRVTATVDFAASAGTGAWQEENLGIEVSFYEDEMAEDYDSIGIVVGNSMEPVLKNGDYLFVKVTTDIPNGALSIWQVNGENFVKKFRNNGSPYLESLNPDYDDIDLTPDDDIRPLAVVVDVYREG